MMKIKMPRYLRKGEVNPNTGAVAPNLDEKVQEEIDHWIGNNLTGLPLVLDMPTPKDLTELTSICLSDIVGYVVELHDDYVVVELTTSGEYMMSKNSFNDKAVQFGTLSHLDTYEVVRVIKAILCSRRPGSPNFTVVVVDTGEKG